MRPAYRRYHLHSIPALALLALLVLLPEWLPQALPAPPHVALLLSPLLPAAFIGLLYLRYLRESDELERKVEVEALGWSVMATLLVALGGLLLLRPGGPALAADSVLIAVLLVQTGAYSLARLWLRRRYA